MWRRYRLQWSFAHWSVGYAFAYLACQPLLMSFMGNSFNVCCSCSSHGWCWHDGRCRFSLLLLYDGRGWFFLLFHCPPIPAVVFMDIVGILKATSLWLLYLLHLLWWMFSVSSWYVLVCDYLDMLESFLGFLVHFFIFIVYWRW